MTMSRVLPQCWRLVANTILDCRKTSPLSDDHPSLVRVIIFFFCSSCADAVFGTSMQFNYSWEHKHTPPRLYLLLPGLLQTRRPRLCGGPLPLFAPTLSCNHMHPKTLLLKGIIRNSLLNSRGEQQLECGVTQKGQWIEKSEVKLLSDASTIMEGGLQKEEHLANKTK